MPTRTRRKLTTTSKLRSWEEICESVLWPGGGLCGPDPETNLRYRAVAHVLARLPKPALLALEQKVDDFLWYIPDAHINAEVKPFPCTTPRKGTRLPLAKVLYLGPAMERRSFGVAVATVAHDLAHLHLNHELYSHPDTYKKQEREAWRLVIAWGFREEERLHRAFYDRYHARQRALTRTLVRQLKQGNRQKLPKPVLRRAADGGKK